MDFLLNFILHIDQYMAMIVRDYHAWTYAILFIIIFCETGLVVTPFLPGDSTFRCRSDLCVTRYAYQHTHTRYHIICCCHIR